MNDDPGWDKIIDAIDTKFGIENGGKEDSPLEDKPELTQHARFIVFIKDGERFKLERVTRPAILDRKSIHGRSAVAGVRFENVYDPEDVTRKTNLYIERAGEWAAIEPEQLGL